MCTLVHISVTKWCIVGYGTEALWNLCGRSVGYQSSSLVVRTTCPIDTHAQAVMNLYLLPLYIYTYILLCLPKISTNPSEPEVPGSSYIMPSIHLWLRVFGEPIMWLLWLNWRKSILYRPWLPMLFQNENNWWPIVTSSIHEPAAC